MKQLLVLGLSLLLSSFAIAQKSVTTFMGIPVDGTKQAMIQKLKGKGFTYNASCDCLKGQFNGRDSRVHIATNGNKVRRIMVEDENYVGESEIKIRFNTLTLQFAKNGKYLAENYKGYSIDDDEDISYEMTVNKKRFEAAYYQLTDSDKNDTTGMMTYLINRKNEEFSEEEWASKSDDEKQLATNIFILELIEQRCEHRSVWFMIGESYGKYGILLFYDNKLNEANGEDL